MTRIDLTARRIAAALALAAFALAGAARGQDAKDLNAANEKALRAAAAKAAPRLGRWGAALGRTLDPTPDHPPRASNGIVSATNRICGKAIQTDAKASPTNYGGPLVAIDGRVLGILVPADPETEGATAGFEWY